MVWQKNIRALMLAFLGLSGGGIIFWGGIQWYRSELWQCKVDSIISRLTPHLKKQFSNVKMLVDHRPIALVAFKQERRLELWKWHRGRYRWIKNYRFTVYSGHLGPKLRFGDRQIPEGMYRITNLNPYSSYHLSMKLNYPNAFDRVMARKDHRTNLGGDIYIHGRDVTIGCIPVGDRAIEELFTLLAKNGYWRTRVLIAPYDMRDQAKQHRIPSSAPKWTPALYKKLRERLRMFQRI
ncbi:MAG: L,D-transpeptidase family protein [Myxococcota bacterium]